MTNNEIIGQFIKFMNALLDKIEPAMNNGLITQEERTQLASIAERVAALEQKEDKVGVSSEEMGQAIATAISQLPPDQVGVSEERLQDLLSSIQTYDDRELRSKVEYIEGVLGWIKENLDSLKERSNDASEETSNKWGEFFRERERDVNSLSKLLDIFSFAPERLDVLEDIISIISDDSEGVSHYLRPLSLLGRFRVIDSLQDSGFGEDDFSVLLDLIRNHNLSFQNLSSILTSLSKLGFNVTTISNILTSIVERLGVVDSFNVNEDSIRDFSRLIERIIDRGFDIRELNDFLDSLEENDVKFRHLLKLLRLYTDKHRFEEINKENFPEEFARMIAECFED